MMYVGRFRFRSLFFVTLFFLFCGMSFPDAEAARLWPLKSANLCWQMSGAEGEGIIRIRSFAAGNGNFLISGKVTATDGTISEVINGNAVTDGSEVRMTLNGAGGDSEAMWSGTYLIVLDSSSLNGTFEWIGHDRNHLDLSIDTEYANGTVTRAACPK